MHQSIFQTIAAAFAQKGIECFFVGGCVRDSLIGIASDDIDICLVGVSNKSDVVSTLKPFCESIAAEVGNDFPVWIAQIDGIGKVDFALARTERKTGESNRDFACLTQNVSIQDDLSRRDLTVNSMAQNVRTGEIIDPFGGRSDLENKVARHVSGAFAEDTLRVIRAARFCARFDLAPTEELIAICRELRPDNIPSERIGKELEKLFEQSAKPSVFFRFLEQCGWLGDCFPEVSALVGVVQSPIHHPEGDTFNHTMLCIDQAKDPFTRLVMLCHDLGKAVTTTVCPSTGKTQAIGHDEAGVPIAKELMNRLCVSKKIQDKVALLVELHMIHAQTPISDKVLRRTLRRLMAAGIDFEQLVEVCRCDVSGRAPKPAFTPDIRQADAAKLVESGAMTPIVTAKTLMGLGMKPGKHFGAIINKALELQDRGTLTAENWRGVLKSAGFDI